jgi:hypothetical protein
MSLVVSVMCLMMASCSGSKPIEVSDNDQSRFEELTKELRKKAQGGDASAQNELGLLYYEGRGVGQNYRKAKEWFDKAVEQGHTGAQVNLGTLYLRGEGAPQSSQMALFWFTRAAGQEDALALAKLGSGSASRLHSSPHVVQPLGSPWRRQISGSSRCSCQADDAGPDCRSAAAGSRMEATRREITKDRVLVALSVEPTQFRSNPSADTLS